MWLAICLSAVGGASPFYELQIVARDGSVLHGIDPPVLYVTNVARRVTLNDAGRIAFRTAAWRPGFYEYPFLIASDDASHTNIHRIENVNSSMGGFTLPTHFFHLNNDNQLVASILSLNSHPEGPSLIAQTYDIDEIGGDYTTVAGANPIHDVIYDGELPAPCGCQPGYNENCIHYYSVTMDDNGNAAFLTQRSPFFSPSCDYWAYENVLQYNTPPGSMTAIDLTPLLSDVDANPTDIANSSFGVPMAGNTAGSGNPPVVILKQGLGAEEEIFVMTTNGTKQTVASAAQGWSDLGNLPGLSSDGIAFAFGATAPGSAPGIYLGINHPDAGGIITNILNTDTDFAVNNQTNMIQFASFSYEDQRLPVIHQDSRTNGTLINDHFIIAFIGTPDSASVRNPDLPGTIPLLFSGQKGLWTIQVEAKYELSGSSNLTFNTRSILPVIQVGDSVGGEIVLDIDLWNGLGRGTKNLDGTTRQTTPFMRDHIVGFWVQTTGGNMILRAAHLDSDGDGLPDHWERSGGGIDMDRDGVIDLDLNAWGARPDRLDLFLEFDWLAPRTNGYYGPWRNNPHPGLASDIATFFATAPFRNPDLSTGITVHVDGGLTFDTNGPPASVNTGTGTLDGGDVISDQDSGGHIDVVYMGSNPAPGVVGLITRSLEDIKRFHFGRQDKWARELVFRYCLFADFLDVLQTASNGVYRSKILFSTINSFDPDKPLTVQGGGGSVECGYVKIITGTGAGQIRKMDCEGSTPDRIRIVGDWATIPDDTSEFVLIQTYGGEGEVWFNSGPNFHSLAGNDIIISLAGYGPTPEGFLGSPYDQHETMIHEIGHTLGLRHGGNDDCEYKGGDYLSLMSYSHLSRFDTTPFLTNECAVPPTVAVDVEPVTDFSYVTDATFYDWSNFDFAVYDSLLSIGNSQLNAFRTEPLGEMDVAEYTGRFGIPPDSAPPIIQIVSPGANTNIPAGSTLEVTLRAEDNASVSEVNVLFDINGNGVTDGSDEVLATHQGSNLYYAAFTNVSGAGGSRSLRVSAMDNSGNTVSISPNLYIGAGDSGDQEAPFVTFLNLTGSESFEEGSWIRVLVNVYDFRNYFTDGKTEYVFISIDANGNGVTNDPGEMVQAYEVSPMNYQAVLPALSGSSPGTRVVRVTAYDDWLNVATGTRTINVYPTDTNAPVVNVVVPSPGQVYSQGDVLTLDVTATDNGTIGQFYATFDRDGDGTIFPACEKGTLVLQGGNLYRRTFNACGGGPITGPPGVREVVVSCRDISGNLTVVTQQVEVVADMQAPILSFNSPSADMLVGVGQVITANVTVVDAVTVQVVNISFDLNGDGITTGATEVMTASKVATDKYQVLFGPVSGPVGSRIVTASASDANTNSASIIRSIVIATGGRFLSPPENARVVSSGTEEVAIEVVPGLIVSNVLVRFDLNGDGDTDDAGERVWLSVLPGSRQYGFTLANVYGSPGFRTIYADIIGGGITNTISLMVEVMAGDAFLGVRSSHLGWIPNQPESLADGTLSDAAPLDVVPAYAFLYFTARDGVSGRELWRTDGSSRGTRLVQQLLSAGDVLEEGSSEVKDMIALNDRVYFGATDFIGNFTLYSQSGLVGNELWSSDGTPGQVQLVKDVRPPASTTTQPPGESDPESLAAFANRVWFTARTESNGWQLGYSDGTSNGTAMVIIDPVYPGPVPTDLTVANTQLFFAIKDGTELWKTDGTPSGATEVKSGFNVNGIRDLKAVGSRVFINASEDLWISDGTAVGTFMTRDINPDAAALPNDFTAWDSNLYFTANDGSHGRELWRSDGTSNGTVMVCDLIAGSAGSAPSNLIVFQDAIYFAADHPALGRELWRSDGTATGTVMVTDLAPYTGTTPIGFSYPRRSSSPEKLMIYRNKLYFSADDGQGKIGRELYCTDGTPEGTTLVRDIYPGVRLVSGGALGPQSSNPEPVGIQNDKLLFKSTTGYQTELWRTDGTAEGTHMVRNIFQAEPSPLFPAFGDMFFSASDMTKGRELWRASTSGVFQVADLFAGVSNSAPYDLVKSTSCLFFCAAYTSSALTTVPTRGLYAIHETNPIPVRLKSFVELGSPVFPPQQLSQDRIVFRARDTNGVELWVSDGTTVGTFELKNINPGAGHSNPSHPQIIGSEIWFAASNSAGWGIWKTDGSITGTVQVADINPGTSDAAPGRFTKVGSNVVFVGFTSAQGAELWRSDGTSNGTVRITDLRSGSSSSFPFNTALMYKPFTVFQGSIYARGFDNTLQNALWKSDGTTNGTVKVGVVDPGDQVDTGFREAFVEYNGWLYFAGQAVSFGIELYRTDGNTVELVRNIAGLNPSGSFEGAGWPLDFVVINGRLLFTAFDWTYGRELWTSDGTFDGTVRVKDIHPFRHHSDIAEMTVVESNMFFVATEGRFGRELWRTDGTTDGTMIVEDLAPGPMSSKPQRLTVMNNVLYYVADAGGHNLSMRKLIPGNSLFDDWLATTTLTGADRGLFADPNGNQLANLHEFLLGTDPENPLSTPSLITPIGVNNLTGNGLFEFSYQRHTSAEEYGLDVIVEISGDLREWVRVTTIETTSTPLGSGYERITLQISAPFPFPNPIFVRLRHPYP